MNQQKALVAQTVQVGEQTLDIAVNDIVDFDKVIGTVERPNPDGKPDSEPVTLTVKLGDAVNATHFEPVKPAAESTSKSADAPAATKPPKS